MEVAGPAAFIVTVGQQLAWLGSVFQCSTGQLALSYADFTSESSGLNFSLQYEVVSLDDQEKTSCWNELVGNVVLVPGFPIPERPSDAIGLEISLQLMATLADIPLATCYRRGYILKGRSLALVPVSGGDGFVQWHLFQKNSGRVSLIEIHTMFPERLLLPDLNERTLSKTRAFLGWCSRSCNHLGVPPINAVPSWSLINDQLAQIMITNPSVILELPTYPGRRCLSQVRALDFSSSAQAVSTSPFLRSWEYITGRKRSTMKTYSMT